MDKFSSMNIRQLKKIAPHALIILVLFGFALTVAAQGDTGFQDPRRPEGLPDWGRQSIGLTLVSLINRVLLPFAATIAVIFIIIGGYQYIFSGASEELAAKGKKTLVNAIIGLVIIILSFTIISVISNTLRIN